jgi:hypothetical protein
MTKEYKYVGDELELFENVKNWKKYVSELIYAVVKDSKLVVEIGSGIGANAPYLLAISDDYIGIEPDEKLVKQARLKFPAGHFVWGFSSKLDSVTNPIDLICYIDVLEHIEFDQLEVDCASKYLQSGGFIAVLVPAHNFLFSKFDKSVGHFRRYDAVKILELVPDGFDVVYLKQLDVLGGLISLLSKFSPGSRHLTKRNVTLWDNLIPASRIIDKIIKNKFGKSLLLIMKNRD